MMLSEFPEYENRCSADSGFFVFAEAGPNFPLQFVFGHANNQRNRIVVVTSCYVPPMFRPQGS